MLNATSRDRVAEQFRDAADAARALAIQENEEPADPTTEIPPHIIRGDDGLMLNTPDSNSSMDIGDNETGKAMRVVAEKLAAHGFNVRGPDWEGSRRLTITNAKHARCEIAVEDDGSVTWDYWPRTGRDTDPTEITGLVMRVLGAESAQRGEPGTSVYPGLSLKGVVGRALDARGLKVGMTVYEDRSFYDVAAEIVVTNPARPERGQVCVTDDGDITWERDHDDAVSADAGEIADAIVNVLTEVRQRRRLRP